MTSKRRQFANVACDYCRKPARLLTGHEVYPHRPDLAGKWFWVCRDCNAYVGTHVNSPTFQPLGRLANAELRTAKQRAHAAFDPVWKAGGMRRREAYLWLADQLGINAGACHIGMFDVATCQRVVEVMADRNDLNPTTGNPSEPVHGNC